MSRLAESVRDRVRQKNENESEETNGVGTGGAEGNAGAVGGVLALCLLAAVALLALLFPVVHTQHVSALAIGAASTGVLAIVAVWESFALRRPTPADRVTEAETLHR